ncbi:MAG: bifunctional [glutamate--ammonia ligase]-adenylyl-L-tyrosine phosphorylase/[glutamate--ammonia-ligase] adenylyltransferase [Gammaproteobacteria bacterium]|nr:bifunctional [glutamate--ammonia ligase]-adenylyl-L-tyrosine phosphorylase/[glutamate--ammonia-ligase] adenylyltransferase [Gammaproteobacteria bacterium]
MATVESSIIQLPETLQPVVSQSWQEWLTVARSAGISIEKWDETVAETLPLVWVSSDFVTNTCVRHPLWMSGLIESGDLLSSFSLDKWQECWSESVEHVIDMDSLQQVLRQFRNRAMLRIIWRDIAGWADLAETTRDLSWLAETCIDGAMEKLYQWQCEESGTPVDEHNQPMHMVVIGMGKLGAYELNVSSDIDLIFAYAEDGEIQEPRPLSHAQFFTRLGQKLIQALDNNTADGFVFRVDMRLRPFGDSGALAASFAAMENYYLIHGREWERYALIKARVVAGDRVTGQELMETLRPFIYRRYLDYGAYDSLREMKAMIMREVKRKSMQHNVKLGEGGIREVEFIAQVFQLIRGGSDPALQTQSLFTVLDHLAQQEVLPAATVEDLKTGYIFLRTTEHRLQEVADQQTHVLPEDELARLRLAYSMGYADWATFSDALQCQREKVAEHFASVFESPQTEEQDESTQHAELAALWHSGLEAEQLSPLLGEVGYQECDEIFRRLQTFRYGHCYRALTSTGRKRLDQLMPMIIGAAGQSDLPDVTLIRLLDLLERIARRSVYLALLIEYPLALSQLVKLCAASPWVARYLSQHPILLDELLDPRSLYAPPDKASLASDLHQQMQTIDAEDMERAMDGLRHFKHSNVLRVAAADMVGALPLMKVSDHLSWIAEALLEEALSLAWNDMTSRHGRPVTQGDDPDAKGFVIVGYGKLGGLELGYGSDLDLVFLHGGEDPNQMTQVERDEEKSLPLSIFYARLGQRLIHYLTTLTSAGMLYEIDMRLRPDGASGMLVSTVSAFAAYQTDKAWTWEHQALVRARPVAGDGQIAGQFKQVRQTVLCQERDREKLRTEIVEMRQRMRSELDKSTSELFDVKQGVGGIVDIEFIVQYAVLGWGHEYPELVVYTDNIRILEAMVNTGLMSEADSQFLNQAYQEYRGHLHRMALQEQSGVVENTKFQPLREQVSRIRQQWLDTD